MPSVLNNPDKKGSNVAIRWFLEFLAFGILIWLAFEIGGRLLPQIAIKQLSDLTNTNIEFKSIEFRFDGSAFYRRPYS